MTNESSSNNSVGYNPPKGSTARIDWASRDGKSEEIEVIAEWIVLRKKEKPSAEIFNTYYRLVQPQNSKNGIRRAITFVLNGGPGAASAYLHLGGLGPQRVCFNKDGSGKPRKSAVLQKTFSSSAGSCAVPTIKACASSFVANDSIVGRIFSIESPFLNTRERP